MAARRAKASDPDWVELDYEALLGLRLKDLGLRFEGSWVEPLVEQLHEEMAAAGIRFKPHVWISSEWFSPDGVPGIAIPFYLFHPRLMALERRQMMEVEGSTKSTCMKILRHEAGHAVDTAYGLRRLSAWRRVFGPAGRRYPTHYQPRMTSREYVQHLDWWYAQSHPVEDFAETFAVWLGSEAGWRRKYADWPALEKLEFVDELMAGLGRRRRVATTRRKYDPISRSQLTLREHYEARRAHYGVDQPDFYDAYLKEAFEAGGSRKKGEPAAAFLRRNRADLRGTVAYWTGQHPYTVDQFLLEMVRRARKLDLRVPRAAGRARRDVLVVLTVQVMRGVNGRGYRIAL